MTDDRSRVLTLVFTDLADSTALKSARGDAAMDALLTRHREHVSRLAQECAGRIIDWAGDGCFLTFETSSAAVMFALRLQQAHSEESDLPGVRIGVHLGEVTERAGPDGATQVKGLAVDVAARIEGLAKPGQVLMSAAVHNSAKQRMGVEAMGMPLLWQLHGTYELKGFDAPLDIAEAGVEGVAPLTAPKGSEKARLVRKAKRRTNPTQRQQKGGIPAWAFVVTIVALLGAIGYLLWDRVASPSASAPSSPAITSLAVLPLDNLSPRGEEDYFAESMTEAITAELAKIQALKIRGRTSAMQYKDTSLEISEIAEALNVDALIEGSVTRVGDDVRITVQLVHGASDTHLWSETYTETITSVLKLQADVALAIAEAIDTEITGEERERITTSRNVDSRALEAYQLGERFFETRTKEDLDAAMRYFEDATRLDPGFAEAWVKLGEASIEYAGWYYGAVTEYMPKAKLAFERALELDADLSGPHAGLGDYFGAYEHNWKEAEAYYTRAITLSPSNARVHAQYAWYLRMVGRIHEAMEHSDIALEIDPKDPNTVRDAEWAYLVGGQPDRVRRRMEELLETHPDFYPAMETLCWALLLLDKHTEAIAVAERCVELSDRSVLSLGMLAQNLYLGDETEKADAIIEEIEQQSGGKFRADLVDVYVISGRLDDAFAALDYSLEKREPSVLWFRINPYDKAVVDHPNMIALRSDSRYWEFCDRMNFPPFPPDHPGYADEMRWMAKKAAREMMAERGSVADQDAEPIGRIAVLPFANISGDTGQEWFVDGMTEAITMELARIKALTVVSRTSAMQYKGVLRPMSEIASELGVDALVEGSAVHVGDRVRITAQLIDGRTDEHLWADRYDGTMEDILNLQSEVALAIAGEVQAAVSPEEQTRLASARPIDPEAYRAYLRGTYLWNRRELEEALPVFEQAVELAPDFALAHSGLANTYVLLGTFGTIAPAEASSKTRTHAERALELDPLLPDAYAAIGWALRTFDNDLPGGDEALLRAQELDPEYPTAHYWYALSLVYRKQYEEALAESLKAVSLDPVSIPTGRINVLVHFVARRYEEVVPLGLAHLEIAPHDAMVVALLSNAYLRLSDPQKAREVLDRYPAWKSVLGTIGIPNLVELGLEAEGRIMLEELLERRQSSFAPAATIGRLYLILDEREEAIRWMETAALEDSGLNNALYADPDFDEIRDDPRIQAIIEGLNIPEN